VNCISQEDLRSLRRELESKAPVIENNLHTGRNYLASDPSAADASDNEGNVKKKLAFPPLFAE
jgi:hypothetical protein